MQQSESRCAIFGEIETDPELNSKRIVVGKAQKTNFLNNRIWSYLTIERPEFFFYKKNRDWKNVIEKNGKSKNKEVKGKGQISTPNTSTQGSCSAYFGFPFPGKFCFFFLFFSLLLFLFCTLISPISKEIHSLISISLSSFSQKKMFAFSLFDFDFLHL